MRKNPVKEKLRRGKPVVGAFANVTSAVTVEILGLLGMDFVILDAEHGPIGAETAENGEYHQCKHDHREHRHR